MNIQDTDFLNGVPKVMKINSMFPDSVEFLDICSVSREWNVSTNPLHGTACGRIHPTLEGMRGIDNTISTTHCYM